jgi:uroporphyrinogen decarboxylase
MDGSSSRIRPADTIYNGIDHTVVAVEVGRRGVGQRPVRVENDAAVGWGCHHRDGDGVAVNVAVEKVTLAVTDYLRMQIEAGVDAVQLFDSWGAALPASDYEEGSLKWIRRIVASLPATTPVILFAKGVGGNLPALASSGARVLGFDWTVDLPTVRSALPAKTAVQGTLDPVLMNLEPAVAAAAATRLLDSMSGLNGHVFNLGHGILPQARPESMAAVCEAVVGWSAT